MRTTPASSTFLVLVLKNWKPSQMHVFSVFKNQTIFQVSEAENLGSSLNLHR